MVGRVREVKRVVRRVGDSLGRIFGVVGFDGFVGSGGWVIV